MTMQVTITQPNVYSSYGILMPQGSVQTVDNQFGASLVYANRATDTLGVLAAPTNKPFDITIETPIYPVAIPGTTSANIQAAMDSLAAAGGGTVQLPAGRIVLTTTLQMRSSVRLKGVAPTLIYNTIPDSGLTSLVGSTGGTVLVPSSGIDAIAWNLTALGVPASQTAFSQLALTNIAIEDIGFSGDLGGIWGIHAGATNNASAWYSNFVNVYFTGFTNASGGGISITNYQHCKFISNYSFGCAWGQLHQIDVASASLAPGNSTYYDLYCCNPIGSGQILTRSITFVTTATTGGAANNNEFKFDRMQSNRFGGSTITQAATMANLSANITITDGTKFAVGLPVTVDATQNGFTLKKIYFVASVASNVITLANTYGGAAVTATGSTAVNITHTGFPCFEMIALAGSTNTNVVMDNVDVEGFGTIGVFFQNCNGVNVQMSQVPSTGQATQSVCLRGCANKIVIAPQNVNTDDDANAVGSASMFFGSKFGTSVGYQGMGLWYDSVSNKSVFSMGYQNDGQAAGLLTWDPSTLGGLCTPKNAGIGHFSKNVNSLSFAVSSLNCVLSNGTLNAVNTLPTVNANNFGSWLRVINHTANAQTINTDGTQLFNGVAGRTSITVNAGAAVDLEAVQSTTAPAYTWDIIGGTSACVAGVISAPS